MIRTFIYVLLYSVTADGEAAETGEVHTKADKVVRMEIEVKVLDNSQIRSRFEDEE